MAIPIPIPYYTNSTINTDVGDSDADGANSDAINTNSAINTDDGNSDSDADDIEMSIPMPLIPMMLIPIPMPMISIPMFP